MSIHFKPFTAISSQLRAIYSRIKRCPNISSHFQPFQANYGPFTDILTHVQPFQANYSQFNPFPAISRHFQPIPPILAHSLKGAGYSDGLRQIKTKAALRVTLGNQKVLKIGPYTQWQSWIILGLSWEMSIRPLFF